MAKAARPDDRTELAALAWRHLFDFFISTRGARDDTLERLGLTPNDARALHTLLPDEGRPMGALAAAWGTDRSNATWVVDRLERLGLAERRSVSTDRRVKLVVLTPKGLRTRNDILRAFHEPPSTLLALDAADLKRLAELLQKLAPPAGAWASPVVEPAHGRRRRRRDPA